MLMRMRFALALFLLIIATRANDEYVEERFIDAASFGGTVYIAISPGSIHDSVFSILLPFQLSCIFFAHFCQNHNN